MMEKTLQYQEVKVLEHKKYLLGVVNDHRIVLLATVLPAFLWGWKKGKHTGFGKMIKQISKAVILTYYSYIKRNALTYLG